MYTKTLHFSLNTQQSLPINLELKTVEHKQKYIPYLWIHFTCCWGKEQDGRLTPVVCMCSCFTIIPWIHFCICMCIHVYAQCIWWYFCPLDLLDKDAHMLSGPADVLTCEVEPGVKTHMRGEWWAGSHAWLWIHWPARDQRSQSYVQWWGLPWT